MPVFINKSQSLDDGSSDELEIFYQNLNKVKKQVENDMISFVETMNKIKEEYNAKLDLETSNKGVGVGVYDEDLQKLIHELLTGQAPMLKFISVVGMARREEF
ncbi:hypothetical protein ACJIZ3_003682 [Penstemon smallii]|uniref:Uncharacterized protein n=1 Tax=Penstemon smallii TaxID=265156 RepID=A0ABD3U9V6_9LAMI